jgi:hypothetical protein
MSEITRRAFVGSAVASAAVTVVPRHVLGGAGHVAPNDKITMAHIGMGTQSLREVGALLAEPQVQIVAVCDPNTDSHDYVDWSKTGLRDHIRGLLGNPSWREGRDGCPGGREVGREVIETYYANHRGKDSFKSCRLYDNFRELLEKESGIDAVKVMTPDHLHATVAIAAMKKGKRVLMHKPIANRLHEGRLVLQTARETGVETHLMAYGSGAANGQIVQRIKEGVIGPLREIHNWTNRPVWPQYTAIPTDTPPVPKGFDWDLWLGPALARPYHPCYTHAVFRGWYDFGGGSMADMGNYSLWPIFTGLGLEAPLSAEAWATHTCEVVDGVSRTKVNDFAYPTACTLRFRFAARGDMPPMELFWYDGGMRPRLPDDLEKRNAEMPREGILFIGDQGTIMAGFHGKDPQVYAQGKVTPLALGEPAASPGHPWLLALRGEPSPGSFLNAGPITDTINLGGVALRAGMKVVFDSQGMKFTNAPEANKYLYREYREGWKL